MRQANHIGTEPLGVLSPGRNTVGSLMGGEATALSFVESSAVLQYVRADAANVTLVSGRVSQWNDLSGAGLHYTQADTAKQPLYFSSGGSNGHAYVSNDSAARFIGSSLNLPAPGTTPTTIWAVFRQAAWIANLRIFDSNTPSTHMVWQRVVEPRINMLNQTEANNNTAATVGAWVRAEVYFSNTTSDYLKLAATNVTGQNAANSVSTGRNLGSNGSSAAIDWHEVLYVNRALTAAEKTALDAYVTARYGPGLV